MLEKEILGSESSFAKANGSHLARSRLILKITWKAGLQLDAGGLSFRLVIA